MTRKVFNELAAELKHARPKSPSDAPTDPICTNRYMQWCAGVQAVANVCLRFNPGFDENRFKKACGYED